MTAPVPSPPPPKRPGSSAGGRLVAAALLSAAGVLLAVVILTPVALSSQDLIDWAAAPTGLALPPPWPWLVFLALDAAAGACVLLAVYCAWRGEPAGVFGVLVWCFAAGSAFANWRHSRTPAAAPDAVWFFPAMSLAGPALLDAVLRRLRRWAQRDTGRRNRPTPAFGWRRWTPGIGATRDTYGAYRTALLAGIDTIDDAITAYHTLCPTGSLRVAAALRTRHTAHPPHPPAPTSRRRTDRRTTSDAALLNRIPTQPDAYRRWRTVWTQLQHNSTSLTDTARRHRLSLRQVQFIRRAGEAGLLNSPHPPDRRRPTGTTTTPPPTEPAKAGPT